MKRWSVRVEPSWSFAAWRAAARAALSRSIPPDRLDWLQGAERSLLDAPPLLSADAAVQSDAEAPLSVPRAFVELAATCLCHRDPQRMSLLYRMLWRISAGERALVSNPTDADVLRATAMAQAVRRDSHKMKAFVRFREVPGEADAFIAWFEPEHFIVDRVAPFFARRFVAMRWAILTPSRSVRWDGHALSFGPGGRREEAPGEDAREDMWRTYYASIFNPARLNTRMMQQEMPARYWKHLPEATLLPALVRDAASRVQEMHDREARGPQRRTANGRQADRPVASLAGELVPAEVIPALRREAAACRRCPLWEPATQTVFSEGPLDADIMIVGEQPGDKEDLSGRPFVGPAGQLFNRALLELDIDRSRLYLTNAVKHFRFQRRGKYRVHQRPDASHVKACQPWLLGEIASLRPKIIVCLGASAAGSVLGKDFSLMRDRGRWLTTDDGTRAFATVHPSWVLRQERQEDAYRLFVDDLRRLKEGDGGG